MCERRRVDREVVEGNLVCEPDRIVLFQLGGFEVVLELELD